MVFVISLFDFVGEKYDLQVYQLSRRIGIQSGDG